MPRLARNPYPPHNPGQRYIRTGALGRSWQAGATDSGAKIVNNRPYASYVVGTGQRAGQAWMHVGRWWYGIDIVKEETDQLKEMIADRMKEMLATGGGQMSERARQGSNRGGHCPALRRRQRAD